MNSTLRLMNQQTQSQLSRRRSLNSTQTELQLKQKSPQSSTSQNLSMEKARGVLEDAVRGVILIIVFVFDPLAVLLLVAGNQSLVQEQVKRRRRNTQRRHRKKKAQETAWAKKVKETKEQGVMTKVTQR